MKINKKKFSAQPRRVKIGRLELRPEVAKRLQAVAKKEKLPNLEIARQMIEHCLDNMKS